MIKAHKMVSVLYLIRTGLERKRRFDMEEA
jgi:hypothetical protein